MNSYFLAPSASYYGQMKCKSCGSEINPTSDDYSCKQQTLKHDDWKYVTEHRKCATNQSGWLSLEKKQKRFNEEVATIESLLKSFDSNALATAIANIEVTAND